MAPAIGAALLAACGGGVVQSGAAVTGVALGDAPLAGAAVTLSDSSAGVEQRTASTRDDGSFSLDVTGLTPPFVVRVEAGGRRLYAVTESQADVDVTPITDLASSYAAGSAGGETLLAAPAAQKRAAAVRARAILTDVTAEAAPLLNRYGIASLQGDKVRVRRLLQDVTVRRSGGTVTLANKRTGGVIQVFPFPDGSAAQGGSTAGFVPGGTFDPGQIPTCFDPGEWDPGQLPTSFDPIIWDPGQLPSNLGPGWDPGLSPSSWADPGNWFDPGLIPSIFDPGTWPDPGQTGPGGIFDPGQIPSNLGPIGCFDPGTILPSPGASDVGSWMGSIASLYGSLCSNCHGGLQSSSHRNTTASQVLAKHGNMVTERTAAGLSAALSDTNECGSSPGASSGGTIGSSSSSSGGPSSSSGGPSSSSGGWFPSSGGSSPPSGGSSSGASSSGGTTRLPAGHPAIPAGTSCSKCH